MNTKYLYKILAIFLFIFLLGVSVFLKDGISKGQKNFLWKIDSDNNTVYLLGSIHFLKKDVYPLPKCIEDAFEKSDLLVVEADINNISKIDIQKLLEMALYSGDDTIEKHITHETYKLLKEELSGSGVPLELIKKQKPWYLALTLTSLELLRLGFDPSYGIDMYFLSKAEGRKKILEIESIDYQIDLLSNFSDEEQEAFLLYTLKNLHTLKKEANALINAWLSGDTETLESIMKRNIENDYRMLSIQKKLIDERNRIMIKKIEEFLSNSKTYFIIVGAGHLVGNHGIVEMLKEKGYKIKQL